VPLDTRITLHKLEVFELVVERGSVSRAAEQLFVSQPAVTEQLRSLEERVGARLFYREARALHLTEAGEAVHAWAQQVLTHTRSLARQLDGFSDGMRGSALIAASMSVGSYLLPEALARFRQRRPQVQVTLELTAQAIEGTLAGRYDFAVVALDAEPAQPELQGELIGEEPLVVVGAPDHVDPLGTVDLAELGDMPFVESPQGLLRRSLVDRQLAAAGVRRRNVVIELGHPEALKRAAEVGLGVTVLFRSAVEHELTAGRLRELPVRDMRLSVPLYLVRRKAKVLSVVQQDIAAAIRDHVARRSPGTREAVAR
jgi:LysR family transcriptional regulator, low CO2-responsive transcriptional regulator